MASLISWTEANQAKMNVNLNKIREEIKSGQTDTRSIVDAWITDMKNGRKQMIACHKATKADTEKINPHPGMMQSVREHQDVSNEEATVMPVGGLMKRHRDRNLAAGRGQKLKGRI
jgi:hypothetical protein